MVYLCSSTARFAKPSAMQNIFEKFKIFNLYKVLAEGLGVHNGVCIPGAFFVGWGSNNVEIVMIKLRVIKKGVRVLWDAHFFISTIMVIKIMFCLQ